MRVVRRFERENETNPREFSSLRPLLRAVDARFEEVFEEVPGDATAWVTYSVWMERLRGADGAEDIIMRGFREGHKELSKTARALLTQRIATSCTARPETRNGQDHMPKQHMSRIDTTK